MNREGPGKIKYLDATWNPVVGCTNGCSYCWARRQAKRQKHNCPKCYAFTPHLHPERLDEPLRTRKPSVIGVAFMGDLFDPKIPNRDVAAVWSIMAFSPWHTYVVLTKQPSRARGWYEWLIDEGTKQHYMDARLLAFECMEEHGVLVPAAIRSRAFKWYETHCDQSDAGICDLPIPVKLPNFVLGVSPWDQESADRLIFELMQYPAAKRIVSIEPCLGSIRIPQSALRNLQGVILGGQTGAGAPPMHPDWVRKVRDDCQVAGVPFFFKQWGEWLPWEHRDRFDFAVDSACDRAALRESRIGGGKNQTYAGAVLVRGPDGTAVTGTTPGVDPVSLYRVGRKAAGRMLDGRTHDEVPWTAGLRPEA